MAEGLFKIIGIVFLYGSENMMLSCLPVWLLAILPAVSVSLSLLVCRFVVCTFLAFLPWILEQLHYCSSKIHMLLSCLPVSLLLYMCTTCLSVVLCPLPVFCLLFSQPVWLFGFPPSCSYLLSWQHICLLFGLLVCWFAVLPPALMFLASIFADFETDTLFQRYVAVMPTCLLVAVNEYCLPVCFLSCLPVFCVLFSLPVWLFVVLPFCPYLLSWLHVCLLFSLLVCWLAVLPPVRMFLAYFLRNIERLLYIILEICCCPAYLSVCCCTSVLPACPSVFCPDMSFVCCQV